MTNIPEALQAAMQYCQAGQLAHAEQLCRQVLLANPAQVNALHLMGMLAHLGGRWDEARAHYQEALRHNPDHVNALNNLGTVLNQLGRQEEAEASYRRALRVQPAFAQAHNNLGVLLAVQGRLAEAVDCYQAALQFAPDSADVLANLGDAYKRLGRAEEAAASYRSALRRGPHAQAHINLGGLLLEQQQFEQAETLLRDAVRQWPQLPEPYYKLGLMLMTQGRSYEALDCYRKAVALVPGELLYASTLLFALHYPATYDPAATFAEHRAWGRQFGETPAEHQPLHPIDRDPERRLRIGYVSGDFREHVMGRYSEAVLGAHDHRPFEIFCYTTVTVEDERTRRIKGLCDHWRSLANGTDAQAAEIIRQDRIDLLIDLSGHTEGGRLGVFAAKPAPVLATHCGYPDTTGLGAIDYRLTDTYWDPPGQTERYHVEKLVRMPEAQWCYVPLGSPEITTLPARQPGAVTFACIGALAKVTEVIIGAWAQILARLPAARLIVVTGAGTAGDQRVRLAFERHGIGTARLNLMPRQSLDGYLRLLQQVDIVLDTYPYAGCNTTADALWMGVPVVTLAGPSCVTRLAVAALVRTGLQDLVTDSLSGYIETALRLAEDLPRLRQLRGQLRERMQRTLGDVERFTRQLEAVYRDMWRSYCETG